MDVHTLYHARVLGQYPVPHPHPYPLTPYPIACCIPLHWASSNANPHRLRVLLLNPLVMPAYPSPCLCVQVLQV